MKHKLVLLAAGRGSRLKELTHDKPKCLNLYNGVPLMHNIIENSKQIGEFIDEIVIIGGYKSKLLKQFGHRVIVNEEWSSSGPFGTLLKADKILSSYNCIISYTDIYYSSQYLKLCVESQDDIFVPSNVNFINSWQNRKVELLEDLESFKFKNGRLLEIGKKIQTLDDVQGQFAGVLKTTPKGWDLLTSSNYELDMTKLDMTSALQNALEKKVEISTRGCKEYWKEFDEPSDFEF